jgi:glucose-1-phosphate thymidylyltransferase
MKALILSGGKGTRLLPITATHAKQLVPIANKPVLFYVLETIVAAGITDIGIVVGETHAAIRAAVKNGKDFGPEVSITYIQQEQPLGLAHAVKIAQPFLQDDRFLMFLGDNFIQEDIGTLVQRFSAPDCSFQAQVLLKQVSNPEQFGVAQLQTNAGLTISTEGTLEEDEKLRIVRLIEKPKDPVSNFAVVGIYFFDAHVFEAIQAIKPSQRGELEITDALQYLIEQGYLVRPHLVQGTWIDTGRKQDMLDANRAVLSCMKGSISPGASIDQYSQIIGEVILEDQVQLIHSTIHGPAIIGQNVTLSHAHIGPFTALARNCTIINSEITHSIILEECFIRDIDRPIEDSLIGSQTEIYPSPARPGTYNFLLADHSHVTTR